MFKWGTVKQEAWHLAFSLHINRGLDNADVAKLGDIALAVWTRNQGNYAFSMYTYSNLIGAGNPNVKRKYLMEQISMTGISFNSVIKEHKRKLQVQSNSQMIISDSVIELSLFRLKTENPNVVKQIPITDIDRVWTYIHFSYSLKAEQAVGFIFAGVKYKAVVISAVYPEAKILRLVVSGSDLDFYPGFNVVQFSNNQIRTYGSYVSTEAELKEFVLAHNPQPQPECDKQYEKNSMQNRKKFMRLIQYQPWHLAFRVTITIKKTNRNVELLGDRDLSAWLGTVEGGSYALVVYTYINIQEAGNANQYQYIKHQDKHTEWHYIYFAYNRSKRLAYSTIWYKDRKQEKTFGKVNHFLAPYYKVSVGKDQFYPAYNCYLQISSCVKMLSIQHSSMAMSQITKDPNNKVKTSPNSKELNSRSQTDPVCWEGDEIIINPAVDQPKPFTDIQVDGDKLKYVREYGYGFWVRFLKRYSIDLYKGKKEPWYFYRLKNNVKQGNVEMGDRVLSIWLGQEGYICITNYIIKTFPKFNKAIPYIYYIYSSIENQGVGFLKYGEKDYKSVTLDVFNTKPTYLRLLIGGTDEIIFIKNIAQFIFFLGFKSNLQGRLQIFL
ncbi:hypothetical protein pb186bvf_005335 [Paramecium bursaria]